MTKMLKEILEQPNVLANVEQINKSTLNDLVTELKERNISHAVFAARGTSDNASIYGQYLLGINKGVVSALALPSCITLYDGQLSLADDLVIGVSQSGKAADALAVIEQGNEQGAVTVAITNDAQSPMAKAAKYHLYCNAGLEESVAATKTFTSQMYLLALLTAYWSENSKLLDELRKLPEYCENMLKDLGEKIQRNVERYRYITEGFVLARGLCYPIALEAALKIQETCYIKMKGYAVSDFYHGPMAQVDTDVPMIIFAPNGSALKDAKDMIEKINSIGAEILTVTNNAELAEMTSNCILIPDTGSEATEAFLFAVFGQYFAQMLSISKGLNPDSPRLLNKVTITK